jgi:hypothetical protein
MSPLYSKVEGKQLHRARRESPEPVSNGLVLAVPCPRLVADFVLFEAWVIAAVDWEHDNAVAKKVEDGETVQQELRSEWTWRQRPHVHPARLAQRRQREEPARGLCGRNAPPEEEVPRPASGARQCTVRGPHGSPRVSARRSGSSREKVSSERSAQRAHRLTTTQNTASQQSRQLAAPLR